MSFTSALRTTFALALLAVPAQAQMRVFGGTAPRMAATRIFFEGGLKGMVCVQYGQPEWKSEYDALDSFKGKSVRLGKDYWTTLNTSVALDFAGTKVPAGSYYLGLRCDAGGDFEILVLRAEAADKAGMAPFFPEAWKPDHVIAMKHAASEKSTDKLTIDLNVDEKDPSQMSLVLSWGKHVLTSGAKVQFATG